MRSLPTIIGLPADGQIGTNRNRLTKKNVIIVSTILLVLLSLGLLIGVVVQATKKQQNGTVDDICLTQNCVSAATHQTRSMNMTASLNLCTDFYTYACGGWQNTHPIKSFDVERTILGDIIDRRNMDIERLLDAPVSYSGENSWEYKVKTYYSECRDDYARVQTTGKIMLGIIQDQETINGWFVFDNSDPGAPQDALLKNQTVYKQMSHIQGDYGAEAIFGVRTRFDENDSTIKRLELYPAGLSMEINDYLDTDSTADRRAAYVLYIVEILGLFAQEAGISDKKLSDRARTVANDVITVEKYLADSLRRNPSRTPQLTTLNSLATQLSFPLDQLVLNHDLNDPNTISILTPIYVTNLAYFQDAFRLLANDDPLFARIIHNYLRWRLVWTYIDDLSYQYVHAHRRFLDAYYGYALHESNEAYCTREVVRRFPLAIQRLLTVYQVQNVNTTGIAQNIFDLLKIAFREYIDNSATWISDEQTKRIARAKIDALTSAIGYTSISADDISLDNYYQSFTVTTDSHLYNSYNYHSFRRWALSNSLKNPNALDHWDLFESRTNRLFDYVAVFNRLFAIASGLQEPIVHPEWPWPVNIGSLGVLFAQKLFSSIDVPEGQTHLPNGTQYNWWQPPTVSSYNRSRNCITDYYVNELRNVSYNVNGVQILVQLSGEPFSPTTLRHIGALRLAYGALMKNDELKSLKMPGTNFNREQTFFLAYAQTQCYQRQGLLQVLRTQLGFYDEKTALNTALIHMPEFATAFQCPQRAKSCFD